MARNCAGYIVPVGAIVVPVLLAGAYRTGEIEGRVSLPCCMHAPRRAVVLADEQELSFTSFRRRAAMVPGMLRTQYFDCIACTKYYGGR